jgi:hypothetical protein
LLQFPRLEDVEAECVQYEGNVSGHELTEEEDLPPTGRTADYYASVDRRLLKKKKQRGGASDSEERADRSPDEDESARDARWKQVTLEHTQEAEYPQEAVVAARRLVHVEVAFVMHQSAPEGLATHFTALPYWSLLAGKHATTPRPAHAPLSRAVFLSRGGAGVQQAIRGRGCPGQSGRCRNQKEQGACCVRGRTRVSQKDASVLDEALSPLLTEPAAAAMRNYSRQEVCVLPSFLIALATGDGVGRQG